MQLYATIWAVIYFAPRNVNRPAGSLATVTLRPLANHIGPCETFDQSGTTLFVRFCFVLVSSETCFPAKPFGIHSRCFHTILSSTKGKASSIQMVYWFGYNIRIVLCPYNHA